MNKVTVPNKRQVLGRLDVIVGKACGYMHGHTPYVWGTIRNDGTVVVRFKSTGVEAAITIAERARDRLTQQGIDFMQTDDVRLQVPLMQFVSKDDDSTQG